MKRLIALRSCYGPTKPQGFTLIEVMIVVAIVAILAAIAIPSYSEYVQRGKIIEGTSRLGDYRTRMEQWFLDHRYYTLTPGGGGCGIPPPGAPLPPGDIFLYSCVATPTTYTYTATGIAAKGMDLFQYSIDERGNKWTPGVPASWSGTNAAPPPAVKCWTVKKDGSC